MLMTLICSRCRKNVKKNGSSGAAIASKLGWSIKDGLMLCPDCAPQKKGGKKRQNSKHVEYDGYSFQSDTEMRYYLRLKKRQERGEIGDILVHPPFTLTEAFEDRYGRIWRATIIKFDFQYTDLKTGQEVVDDVKAPKGKSGKAFYQERAQVLLPIVQSLHPGYLFRWCDEYGAAFPLPGTLKKLPKGTGQKKLI